MLLGNHSFGRWRHWEENKIQSPFEYWVKVRKDSVMGKTWLPASCSEGDTQEHTTKRQTTPHSKLWTSRELNILMYEAAFIGSLKVWGLLFPQIRSMPHFVRVSFSFLFAAFLNLGTYRIVLKILGYHLNTVNVIS